MVQSLVRMILTRGIVLELIALREVGKVTKIPSFTRGRTSRRQFSKTVVVAITIQITIKDELLKEATGFRQ